MSVAVIPTGIGSLVDRRHQSIVTVVAVHILRSHFTVKEVLTVLETLSVPFTTIPVDVSSPYSHPASSYVTTVAREQTIEFHHAEGGFTPPAHVVPAENSHVVSEV